jgi:ubiquinone/menaquinone biosynthesis C-methylase UbiE
MTITLAPPPPARTPDAGDYERFPNMESRNGLQATIEVPLLVRLLRLPTGGRLLEVGCGRGIALPVLAERLAPSSVTGIDVDVEALDEAAHRASAAGLRATLQEADVRALPFDDAAFDLVIDFGTCYHVSGGAEGRRAALAEIARVLRPGGLFVHETRVAQRLAHPVRSRGRRLPWDAVPTLVPSHSAVLWAVRRSKVNY